MSHEDQFKHLSSLVIEGQVYPTNDIRYRLIQALQAYGKHYQKYETILASMPEGERTKALLKLSNAAKKDPVMGWSQFSDVLVEIEGYQYLINLGCTQVEIITEEGCPDIKGVLNGKQVLLEAKQIHNSINENLYLSESAVKPRARSVDTDIPPQLIKKIEDAVCKAQSQLKGYAGSEESMKIIFMIITPDLGVKLNNDLWHELDQAIEPISSKLNTEGITLKTDMRW